MRRGRAATIGGAGAGVVAVLLGAGVGVQLSRPVPRPRVQQTLPRTYTVPGHPTGLPWPRVGQAALYLDGFGWLGSTAPEPAVPIASVTKVMTALVVLRDHPLQVGESGPSVTVSVADAQLYRSEGAAGDSVVPVVAGESLTELQLLEGLLVPSGDNLAVLLADWVSGSESAFVTRMNRLADSLGLAQTHFADSSGLDPASVSSARNLVTLARFAMRSPVFAAVVAMPGVDLPVVGGVRNYNRLLGSDGVVGVKTGWTSSAGGCLLVVQRRWLLGRRRELVAAVLGQPGGSLSALVGAAGAASSLLSAGGSELRRVRLPAQGNAVGVVRPAWAAGIPVKVESPLELVAPAGSRLGVQLRLGAVRPPLRRGARVGTLWLRRTLGTRVRARAILARRLPAPSLWWRLTARL